MRGLTPIGIELVLDQILVCGQSDLVLRYAGEAPLGKVTEKCCAGQAKRVLEVGTKEEYLGLVRRWEQEGVFKEEQERLKKPRIKRDFSDLALLS